MPYGRNQQIETALGYIHGRLEVQIENYAQSLGVPVSELAARLAALLHPSGAAAGALVPLRGMPSHPAAAHSPVGALEMDVRAHHDGTRGSDGHSTKATGQRSYWAKMTPEERRAEMHRRAAKGLGRNSGRRGRPPGSKNKPGHKAGGSHTPAKAAKPPKVKHAKAGSKAARAKLSQGARGFWAKMTADERSAEIKRRQAVSAKKREDWAKAVGAAS